MNMDIFVKDFSGTNLHRILKFGTNIKYDKLNCVLKNQPHILSVPLLVHFSFFPINYSGMASDGYLRDM